MGTSVHVPMGQWMQELADAGIEPVYTIIETVKGRHAAADLEKRWIREFVRKQGGHTLFNRKVGRLGRFDKRNREIAG